MTLGEAFRIAVKMRDEFEFGAADVAAQHAEECFRKGDTDGLADWNRVRAMLRHFELHPDETVH